MAEAPGTVNYPVDELREFTFRLFGAAGVPEDDARIVADSLLEANLRGVDTHGVTRLLGIYIKRLRAGIINTDGRIEVERESPSTVLVDGRNCLGAVVAHKTMRLCLEKAALAGSCWAGIHNSNHCGALAYWSIMATGRDMIGLAFTNGPSSMAPWGGAEAYLSTNPISVAVPAGVEPPIVLDMATSTVSRGRIILAASRGEQIPPGWAVDQQGRPTQDAAEGVKGFVMPLGGYKGYGLSLIVDILSGVLTGAAFGSHIGSLYEEWSRGQDVGTMLGAIDIGKFIPVELFKQRMDTEIAELKACRLAEGSERIYVPGEIEFEKKQRRLVEGVPLDEIRQREFADTGRTAGCALPCPRLSRGAQVDYLWRFAVVEQVRERLVGWLQERIARAGAQGAVLGLSGGIDSAVVGALCQQAFGDKTLALILPINSLAQDVEHATLVANHFGIKVETVLLEEPFAAMQRVLGGKRGQRARPCAGGGQPQAATADDDALLLLQLPELSCRRYRQPLGTGGRLFHEVRRRRRRSAAPRRAWSRARCGSWPATWECPA